MGSRKLIEASNKLAKYYGLYSPRDLAGLIALDQTTGINNGGSLNLNEVPEYLQSVIELLIETSDGAYTTAQMLQKINEITRTIGDQDTAEQLRQLKNAVSIFYGREPTLRFIPDDIEQRENSRLRYASINDMLAPSNNDADNINDFVNENWSAPSKDAPGLSVIYSNSRRAVPGTKNVNPLVIFLNGMPSHELSLATPFLDIRFFTPRSPTANEPQRRLQASSLLRFLIGAERTDQGGILSTLAEANGVTGSILSPGREQDKYTQVGMELFTAPQTLVNADEFNAGFDNQDGTSIRSAPVLNKFLPAASLKSFDISIRGTTGVMSFKSGTLTFIIHDRSRLSEFADFIRPDLYGNTEILIEYGYVHPHANNVQGEPNYYANLINEMRVKEKYGIINSSFTFDDSGQVAVTLTIAMRGGIETRLDNIAAGENSGPIRELREIAETINQLRSRVFRNAEGLPQREIRGIQILDLASDQNAQLILGSEVRKQAKELATSLRGSQSADASNLLSSLREVFGEMNDTPQFDNGTSLRSRIRKSVADTVNEKIRRLATTPDPMLRLPSALVNSLGETRALAGSRLVEENRGLTAEQRTSRREYDRMFATIGNINVGSVSLAKLLMTFVGEPLARTGKFDDVQLIFYPFNDKAGYAKSINIGEFQVDLKFFAAEYTRFRLENVARAGNVNAQDFLRFVASTVLDDPAAISYGLIESQQQGAPIPLYRDVVAAGNRNTEARYDTPGYNERLEKILKDVTGGQFRMPQVDFILECLPGKGEIEEGQDPEDGSTTSILRIHVYDKASSPYSTISEILESQRNEEINSFPTPPMIEENTPVSQENLVAAQTVIDQANQSQLIERIQETVIGNDGEPIEVDTYIVKGGPTAIKNFLYRSVPYIIYGAAGSAVKRANVSTIQNPQLNTVNLLRNLRADALQPTGEQPGGLPLSLVPAEGTLDMYGCPLFEYTQQFFIDFQTGTSIDDLYAITEISHKFEPGDFSTSAKFVPLGAYGKYSSLTEKIRTAVGIVNRYERERQENGGNQG